MWVCGSSSWLQVTLWRHTQAHRCKNRRAHHTPYAGELHWRDVDILLAHSDDVAAQTPAVRTAVTADGRMLHSLLPPPVVQGLTARDVAELLLKIKFNAHPIMDSVGASRVGLGLYPAAALVNHACDFNAVLSFAPGGAVLSVRAARSLREGEAVCYAYIDPLQPRRARRKQLRDAYFFDCACAQCSWVSDGGAVGAGADASMCAMICGMALGKDRGGTCEGMILLPDDRLGVSIETDPLGEHQAREVVCRACGAAHKVHELETCERAAEEILEHCAAALQRDATQGRASLLHFVEQTPEAARLHPSHHLLHKAYVSLGLACHTVGAIRERPVHLRRSLDAVLAWNRSHVRSSGADGTTSPEIAQLFFQLGMALFASLRAEGGSKGGATVAEIDALLSRAHADVCICFGPDSLAAKRGAAARTKVQQACAALPVPDGSGRGAATVSLEELD